MIRQALDPHIYLNLLDAKPDNWKALEQYRKHVHEATQEHNRLMAIARNNGNPQALALAARIAEAWGDLAVALSAIHGTFRKELMANATA